MKSKLGVLLNSWDELRAGRRLGRWLTVGVLLLAIGLLVVLLIRGREDLRQFNNWDAYLGVCTQGFLLYPFSLGVQALIWGMMIARLEGTVKGWRDLEIYAYTHLMRHLPGAVWYLAGRVVMYHARGISAGATLAASGLEWFLLLMTGMVIYAGLGVGGGAWWLPGLGVFALLGAGCLLASKVLRLAEGTSWLRGLPRRWLDVLLGMGVPGRKDLALWVGLYALAYAVGGLILFVLVRGVVPESGLTLIDAVRTWALAAGIGFLISPVVPVNLGVQELTLTALLAPDVHTTGAVLVALLLRMVFLASDLVWGGLLWATARVVGRTRAVPRDPSGTQ